MNKERENFLPLTQSQLSLWTGQRMHPNAPLHNVVYTFDISGDLNERLFKEALQELLDRTDALRLVFEEKNGTPHQRVRPTYEYSLGLLDFSSDSDDGRLHEWIDERTPLPLDLQERIFDTVLLKRGDARYVWFLKIHHLATDAVSNALLYGRMQALYQKLSGDATTEIREPPSFPDYVSYEWQQREDSANDSSRAYWKEKIIDSPGPLKLYGRLGNGKLTAATRVPLRLDAERLKKLRAIAERPEIRSWTEDLSLFTLFMTIYAAYLFRVSGETRLAIGAPAHNRGERQFQDTVGLFIEVLPLFLEIDEEDTFYTVLQRVKSATNSYLRHARPGTTTPEIGRSFNAVLNYINAHFSDFNGFPTRTQWVHSGHMDSSHAIRCHIYDFNNEEGMDLAFDLNRSVFPDAIAGYVPGHFLKLFDALLEDMDLPIGKPSLVTVREKEILSVGPEPRRVASPEPGLEANPESRPEASPKSHLKAPTSILADFGQQVSLRPNAIALQCGPEILTYAALDKKADQWAHYLQKKGIGATDKVALFMHRGSGYIIAILAALKTGAAFIPIASDQASGRIGHILSDSGCSLTITEVSLRERLGPEAVPILIVSDGNLSEENPSEEKLSKEKRSREKLSEENLSEEKLSREKPSEEKPSEGNLTPENLLQQKRSEESSSEVGSRPKPDSPAYVLYTSGSTGRPKGVMISHGALSNYMYWAGKAYGVDNHSIFPLFTSIGFDLTLTSTLLPLLNGGRVIVYPENTEGPDMALMQVLEDNCANCIKLTPSHLALLQGRDFSASPLQTMIVGGEDFKVGLARSISSAFPKDLKIFNEYGPTEATIGCIVGEYDRDRHSGTSVPIGKPIAHMQAYVLDNYMNRVPLGVIGELYLSGAGLANGYMGGPGMTKEKFLANPFHKGAAPSSGGTDLFPEGADPSSQKARPSSKGPKMYRTGDRARINEDGEFEYLGRIDDQVKLRGHRIELADIESNLNLHPNVENCAVVTIGRERSIPEDEVMHCNRCGLPSNYPHSDFDENGICHLCTAFDTYKEKVDRYFRNDDELVRILTSKRGENPTYDCISLLSGGKDSTYVLARLVDMGLNVLAFTMDNGYISEQAKDNVSRITKALGVDHVYGETPHMNDIFVDSLKRHHNVCNGCFKTIYTLSTQIALKKDIPFIVTGLSRGQFFETRLTEELFWNDALDTEKIDGTILEARKIYHREPDAVKNLLDVSAFESDAVFEKVQFVDFYRYSDVSLEDMLAYLKEKIGWVRPTDTGRSTNCLINQVGIYVHKKEEGYSNYAFPYSWDVRLGHKKRQESLDEINETIDENEVHRIMDEIGYDSQKEVAQDTERLVAYFTGDPDTSVKELRDFLSQKLPSYMVPVVFKHLEDMPLTQNGKIDKKALKLLNSVQLALDTPYVAPGNDIEELLEGIWKEVLQLEKVGVQDDFIALGGHSLAAIRVTARLNEELGTDFPLSKIFELPTISEYAIFIEETLTELLRT